MTPIDFLQILRCPESQQTLAHADAALLEKLNQRLAAGQLKNRAGQTIIEPLTEGLVRQDGNLLFPIYDGIPMLLISAAIPLGEG